VVRVASRKLGNLAKSRWSHSACRCSGRNGSAEATTRSAKRVASAVVLEIGISGDGGDGAPPTRGSLCVETRPSRRSQTETKRLVLERARAKNNVIAGGNARNANYSNSAKAVIR